MLTEEEKKPGVRPSYTEMVARTLTILSEDDEKWTYFPKKHHVRTNKVYAAIYNNIVWRRGKMEEKVDDKIKP